MAEKDLKRFIEKVENLQKMVDSLRKVPGRRELLTACEDHNQVVRLARSWGYEIGRRWGEVDCCEELPQRENLLSSFFPAEGKEQRCVLQVGPNWRLELIHSCSAFSDAGFWYDQAEHEWIVILRGSASMSFKSPDDWIDLNVGDYFHIPARRLHRVEQTDSYPGTIWLALFWTETK